MTLSTVTVDVLDPTPPYEQLRRQLADLIGSGVLSPGDRLPPVRQLAADLGLAVGTVARTYRELELAGYVRSRRGGGTRVATTAPAPPTPAASPRGGRRGLPRRARALGATADAVARFAGGRGCVGRLVSLEGAAPTTTGRTTWSPRSRRTRTATAPSEEDTHAQGPTAR